MFEHSAAIVVPFAAFGALISYVALDATSYNGESPAYGAALLMVCVGGLAGAIVFFALVSFLHSFGTAAALLGSVLIAWFVLSMLIRRLHIPTVYVSALGLLVCPVLYAMSLWLLLRG